MRPGPRAGGAAIAGAVAVLGALVWLPALGAGFLGDDFTLLHTVGSVGPFSAFTHNDLGQAAGAGHFYRPVWVLWNLGAIRLFGEHAGILHALNLLLFALVCAEVWCLGRRLLAPAGAALGAVAFAVYPRHAESVAWISGSTDLLATGLGLGALLALPRRRAVAVVLAVAAILAKEAAILVPVLVLLVGWAEGERPLHRWRTAAMVLAGQAAALVVRAIVVGGTGGYTGESLTVRRAAGAAASFATAAFSAPQLELLRHEALLAVPVALALVLLVAIERAGRPRVAIAGLLWFAVALVPVLNLPLDLNTANGERLLLLPSVGLALALGAVVPRRAGWLLVGPLLAAGAVCSVLAARDYREAGRIASDFVTRAAALGPRNGELVVLDLPEAYRGAHVFPDSEELAVARAGRPDLLLVPCVPVHARERRPGLVTFRRAAGAAWDGRAAAAAPFDTPVFGASRQGGAACPYTDGGDRAWPGAARRARAVPARLRPDIVYAVWDGETLRRVSPAGPAAGMRTSKRAP